MKTTSVIENTTFLQLVVKDRERSEDRNRIWGEISAVNGDAYGYLGQMLVNASLSSKITPPWIFQIRQDGDVWWITPNILGQPAQFQDVSSSIDPNLLVNPTNEFCITRSLLHNALILLEKPHIEKNPIIRFLESDAETIDEWFFGSKYKDHEKGFTVRFRTQNAADYLFQMCMFKKIIMEESCDDLISSWASDVHIQNFT